ARAAFVASCDSFITDLNQLQLPTAAAEIPVILFILACFALMTFLIILMLQSNNSARRDTGKAWDQRLGQLKQRFKTEPAELVPAETYSEVKKMANELAQTDILEREKCLDMLKAKQIKLDPDCERKLKRLNETIQSLLQKINAPLGRYN